MTSDKCIMLCGRNKTRQLSSTWKCLSIKSEVTSKASFAWSLWNRNHCRDLWGRWSFLSWLTVPFQRPLDRSQAPRPAGRPLSLTTKRGADGKVDEHMASQSLFWGNGSLEFCVGPSRVIPGSDGVANVFRNFLTRCSSEPEMFACFQIRSVGFLEKGSLGSGDQGFGISSTWPQISHYTLLSLVSSSEKKWGWGKYSCYCASFIRNCFSSAYWAWHSGVYI